MRQLLTIFHLDKRRFNVRRYVKETNDDSRYTDLVGPLLLFATYEISQIMFKQYGQKNKLITQSERASQTRILSDTIRYDTRCYFNVRSKANMSRLNLTHGTDN